MTEIEAQDYRKSVQIFLSKLTDKKLKEKKEIMNFAIHKWKIYLFEIKKEIFSRLPEAERISELKHNEMMYKQDI